MGWVPSSLPPFPSPLFGPPTKSPVSLDAKAFEARWGEGDPLCAWNWKERRSSPSPSLGQELGFPLEISRNGGGAERTPVLPIEASKQLAGVPEGGLGAAPCWGTPSRTRESQGELRQDCTAQAIFRGGQVMAGSLCGFLREARGFPPGHSHRRLGQWAAGWPVLRGGGCAGAQLGRGEKKAR